MANLQFPEKRWTDETGGTWTRKEFLDKLNYEGGVEGMVGWGGSGCFPPSLREMAASLEQALVGNG